MDPFYSQSVNKDNSPVETITENVDPFSGNLSVVQTDIHLPGNGGLDLKVVRAYKSGIWGRRTGVPSPGFLLQYEPSPVGVGWSMHMGILRNPRGNGGNNNVWLPNNPVFELPDGSQQVFFKDKNNSAKFISKDFWTMTVSYPGANQDMYTITAPDGTVYTAEFGTANGGYTLYDGRMIGQVTSIKNAAGNATISMTYYKQSVNNYFHLKTITDSVGRVLTFNYNSNKLLDNITVDSRTFYYTYTSMIYSATTFYYLQTFKPPVINAWSYEYETATNTFQLNGINFPTGGKISYGYTDTVFAVGTTTTSFRVVTSKTTSGRGITGGTWSYAYSSYNSGGSANVTTISAPGVTETHSFYGWGNTGNTNVWKVGLPMSKGYSGNITLSETYTWAKGTLISNDVLSSASWTGSSGTVSDSGISVPFLSAKSITRDGKTFTTTNSNFNTYGDPQTISESGDSGGSTRSRTLTYLSDATAIAKNIVKGKPTLETVTGSFPGTATTSWSYDSNSGNVTRITKDGVITDYDYTNGNLSSITDANSKAKTYLWSNGRISRETNPYYYISRTINSNGTIADETNGRGAGYTTTFGYDGLLRLTSITPPAGNPTSITYPNTDCSIRRETRGGYVTDHTFDGFARPNGSSDSMGVTTTIAYTPYGTKDYEDTNVGDKVSYDYFGRVKEVRHKDNTTITYVYGTTSANETTITDEKTKNTKLTYKAFGNPDEKYLMVVLDSATKTTTYTRNIQGNLTGTTQGSITRSFGYDPTKKNFLTSETNQETGTITYGRDSVGNMTSKSDSSSLTYVYDDINRLTSLYETGNFSNSISFGYDKANNRTSMTYPGGSAGYAFDAINRMYQKTETISGRNYTASFGFDGNDNLQTITYPGGRVVTYGINTKNQVTSITGFGGSVTSVQYFTTGTYLGLPQSYVLSNGITTNLTYNSRSLTTGITAGSAMNIGYGYTDPRGNTTSYTNSLDSSKKQAYDYDDLSRLTSFSGAWGSGSFGYDETGNRTNKTVAGNSTTNNYTNNRISSTSGQEVASYSYSTEGLLSGGTWDGLTHTLNYDKFDNLTSVLAGATTLASFAYDGDGQRVSKTANGKKTVYHYDLGGRTLSEDDGSGNLIADYIYLNGKLVAKVAAAPVVSVTPSSASFGNVYVGAVSTSQTVTVHNTGTADLIIGTLSFTGTNSSEFIKNSDSCSGQTLSQSASCVVQVSFAPVSTGAKAANLTISSNDPATPTLNASLNGIGTLPTLSVAKNGTGTGSVISSPAGISCGQSGSACYTTGTSVTLTAAIDAGSMFQGWSGAGCNGSGVCTVMMNSDISVTATFNKLPPLANFSANPTNGGVPFVVNFTDASQFATSWLWNFGDGTTSTLQNPTYVYKNPGTYTVSLAAINVAGTATTTQNITATTCATPPVKIGSSYYATLQAAYDAAADGNTIQILTLDLTEDLSAGQSKFVTLDGGYLCGFTTNPETTVLHGAPHVSAGTVKLKNIRIAQ